MQKKYKISLWLISILWLFSVTIAAIHFNYQQELGKEEDSAVVVTVGALSLNFNESNEINTKQFIPGDNIIRKFSVSNASNKTIYYSIVLNSVFNDFGKNDDITIQVYNVTTNTLISDLTLPADNAKIVEYLEIEAEKSTKFELKISYKSDSENVNQNLDKTLKATITVQEVEKRVTTFKDVILSSNEVQETSKTQAGFDASTIEEGLIQNQDDEGITYYFRGVVNNNYVDFAGYTWRIVRINGDGSIRVIMNDLINNTGQKYQSQLVAEDEADPNEFMSYTNSEIYGYLGNWYKDYISDYEAYISNSKYCYDNSILNNAEETITYTSYNRLLIDKNPTFSCLGTIIEEKIGLMSADELVFAGAISNYNNYQYYLYNSNFQNLWWTMTPIKISDKALTLFDVRIAGYLTNGSLNTMVRSIRPVINLKGDLEITGDGSKDNPYKLYESKEE